MKIKPLNNYILVTPLEKEEQRSSGIIVKTDDKVEYQKATVEHAGDSDVVKTGDTILLEDFAASKIVVGEEELFFVKEDEIVAVYE